ncbi:MAG: ABC transporter permease [Paracoccus sp. (in: a-proteobacteria)]|uniref:ABC transporter permease n=1 Tax=Paracoccus sp. TaxID=267 RepID=UPI0039E6910F
MRGAPTTLRARLSGWLQPRSWSGFVLRRIGYGAVTVLVISIAVFLATQILPGDTARVILGQEASPERIAELRQQLKLDLPGWERYLLWLQGAVRGDFGTSLVNGMPVWDFVSYRFAVTGVLVLMASVIAYPISVVIAVLSAVRPGSMMDRAVASLTIVFGAVPNVVTGMLLTLIFATSIWAILPAISAISPERPLWRQLPLFVLPALTLALSVAPVVIYNTRAAMRDVMQSSYITSARLNGLPERNVIFSQALPNAMPTSIQAIGVALADTLGGAVVVEMLFGLPGVGSALNQAVRNRDIQVVQALTVSIAVAVVCVFILSDVLARLATPKDRTRRA